MYCDYFYGSDHPACVNAPAVSVEPASEDFAPVLLCDSHVMDHIRNLANLGSEWHLSTSLPAPEPDSGPQCSAVTSSGNDCDLTPTGVLTTADNSHRVYTCETHRNRLTVEFADAEGSFCYTILPTSHA